VLVVMFIQNEIKNIREEEMWWWKLRFLSGSEILFEIWTLLIYNFPRGLFE
jgi:hypothetical protein